jgi:hypothetical protein
MKEMVSEVKAGARLSFRSIRTLEHYQAGRVAVSQYNDVLVLS